jgi:hypothetical protein
MEQGANANNDKMELFKSQVDPFLFTLLLLELSSFVCFSFRQNNSWRKWILVQLLKWVLNQIRIFFSELIGFVTSRFVQINLMYISQLSDRQWHLLPDTHWEKLPQEIGVSIFGGDQQGLWVGSQVRIWWWVSSSFKLYIHNYINGTLCLRWLRTVETVGRQYAFIKFGKCCITPSSVVCLKYVVVSLFSLRPCDSEETEGLLRPELVC